MKEKTRDYKPKEKEKKKKIGIVARLDKTRKKSLKYRKKINEFINHLEALGEMSGEEIDALDIILRRALKNKKYKVINAFITETVVLEPVLIDGEISEFLGVSP